MFSTLPKQMATFLIIFMLSSANAFSLDLYEILSFGKDLIRFALHTNEAIKVNGVQDTQHRHAPTGVQVIRTSYLPLSDNIRNILSQKRNFRET